ncbi:MAG: hypothetical protein N2C14_11475 [Planctomycetales bacterium]
MTAGVNIVCLSALAQEVSAAGTAAAGRFRANPFREPECSATPRRALFDVRQGKDSPSRGAAATGVFIGTASLAASGNAG